MSFKIYMIKSMRLTETVDDIHIDARISSSYIILDNDDFFILQNMKKEYDYIPFFNTLIIDRHPNYISKSITNVDFLQAYEEGLKFNSFVAFLYEEVKE